jgi:2-isopropylmalate synthase
LLEYNVQSVTEGIDALGEVSVRVVPGEHDFPPDKINPQYEQSRARVFHGHGAHTDIIVASAKAYVAAINRILALKQGTRNESKAAGSAA